MRFGKRIVAASAAAAAASLLGLLLVLVPASGADAIDQEVITGPSGHVILSTTAGTTEQTFTPAFPSLTRVDLYLETDLGGPTTGAVDVTLDVFNNGDVVPTISHTVTVNSGFVGGWVIFDFPTVAVAVSPQQYVLDVRVDNTTDSLSWANDTGSTYADGQGFVGGVGQGYDFLFKTYLEDTTGPSITPALSVPAQPDFWYNTSVGLTWTVTDPDSPITSICRMRELEHRRRPGDHRVQLLRDQHGRRGRPGRREHRP